MAITRIIGGGSWHPSLTFFGSLTPQFVANGRVIDASTEKMAFVISCPKSGTIDQVEFRCAAVTQDPGSNGIRISFQDVDTTTGNPDGTQDQYRDITSGISSGAWVIPGLMTSDGTDNGTKRTVSRGDLMCIVWEFVSWQGGSDFTLGAFDANPADVPYFCHNIGGSWSKESFSPTIGLKYDDGTYPYVLGWGYPLASLSTATISNATTPDEIGITFSFPTDVLVGGFAMRCDLDGDALGIIYDSQGTTVRSITLDANIRPDTSPHFAMREFPDFKAAANEVYTLSIQPSSATSIIVPYYNVNDAAMFSEQELGSNWYYRERTDAGEWTDTLTRRPWFSVRVSGFDQEIGGQPSPGFEGLT